MTSQLPTHRNGNLEHVSEIVKLCRKNAEAAPCVPNEATSTSPHIAKESHATARATGLPWRCSLDMLSEPVPEIEYLMHGVIPSGAVVLLSGREGTMKSYLAMAIARHVSEGESFLGRICEARAALYLDGEMPYRLFWNRLQFLGGSRNLSVAHWQDGHFPRTLDDPRLLQTAQDFGLIVVDTLKRFMGSRDENNSTDMAQITQQLRNLTRWGATVLVLHHAPKDPAKLGYRGSTELGAGVDLTLTIEKIQKGGQEFLELKAQKTRYPEDPSFSLRVIRSTGGPTFEDATSELHAEAESARMADLDRLASIMQRLQTELGQAPNQTEIIKAAREQNLGSRNVLLKWLQEGEGKLWGSEADGRSRVYKSIVPLSHSIGAGISGQ